MTAPDPQPVLMHFSTVVDNSKGPVLCKSTELFKPATDDQRYVSCPACLALMTEKQRAQRTEQLRRHGAPPEQT
jgi:hypothetical protein